MCAAERMRPIVPVSCFFFVFFVFLTCIQSFRQFTAPTLRHFVHVECTETPHSLSYDAVQHEFGGDKCIFYCDIYMTDYAITITYSLYDKNDVQLHHHHHGNNIIPTNKLNWKCNQTTMPSAIIVAAATQTAVALQRVEIFQSDDDAFVRSTLIAIMCALNFDVKPFERRQVKLKRS